MGCGGSKAASTIRVKSTANNTQDFADLRKNDNRSSNQEETEEEYNFKPVHSAVRWNKPIEEIEALLNASPKAVDCIDTVT